jgi:hypothetical protein
MALSIVGFFLGIGLAASAGFRIFIPLLVLSVAAHFEIIPVGESFAWIGSITAMISLGIATIVETIAYFLPFVDNLLDTLAIPLAGVAGTLAMATTLVDLDPMVSWALAIIAGGGTAASLTTLTAGTRAVFSATTAGIGNPVLSFIESVVAFVMSIITIFLPIFAFILVIILFVVAYRLFKKLKNKKELPAAINY